MAKMTGRKCCVKCEKDRAAYTCGGCSQEFCFKHLSDHRQELSKQLDEIETSRDSFQQTLNERTNDPQRNSLLRQIDSWEHDSIRTIQQTAAEAREKLSTHLNDETTTIKRQLDVLTKKIQQRREEDDFFETDLKHWNDELTRLTQALTKSANINIQQNMMPLIYNINIGIVSD